MRVAFYKGTRPGIAGLYNMGVRFWERGPYSHVELVFTDGMAASASFIDHGVRFKKIDFDPANWDFIDLPDCMEVAARHWFKEHDGLPYDLLGQLRFVFSPLGEDRNAYWCSEAVAAALCMPEAWRYDPNGLYVALDFFVSNLEKDH